ncbi:hypothetical protein [Thermomonospora umbrina]|uniref:Uncharacterized protein n=1 Tax=Thermomonospora umbrina TaxID=111806 RepID=A0A3D9SHR0_9ACTN|nr:hypothetical protein [Thermomonospora umbrina]REE95432.1 hypothetical protein DFJ69_0820 [Thermomonospora umbrina]
MTGSVLPDGFVDAGSVGELVREHVQVVRAVDRIRRAEVPAHLRCRRMCECRKL